MLYQTGRPMMGQPLSLNGPNPFVSRNLGGMGSSITPTVRKSMVYDARTGQMIQAPDNFTADEIAMGAGTFPGGLYMQAGIGSGSPDDRIGNVGGQMAPPSPTAAGGNTMGSLDNFYAWRQSGMPQSGSSSGPSQTSHVGAPETGEEARLRIFGIKPDQKADPFASMGTSWLNDPFNDPFSPYFVPQRAKGGPISASAPGIADGTVNFPFYASPSYIQRVLPYLMPRTVMPSLAPPPAPPQPPPEDDTVNLGGLFASPNAAISGPSDGPGTTVNNVAGSMSRYVPRMAAGGTMSGMRPYMVGEKGPEVAAYDDGTSEVVGEHGPEVRTFPKDGEIIPNKDLYGTDDLSRRRRQALRNGDFHGYLNTMLVQNVHIPAHG